MYNQYNPFRVNRFQQGGVLPWQAGYKEPSSPINTSYDKMMDQANQATIAAAQRQKARVAALPPYDITKPQWLNNTYQDPTPWNKNDNWHTHEHANPGDVWDWKTKQPYLPVNNNLGEAVVTAKRWTPAMKKTAEWQRRLGVAVDGVWGKGTQRAYEAYMRKNMSVPTQELNMNLVEPSQSSYAQESLQGNIPSSPFKNLGDAGSSFADAQSQLRSRWS